MKISIRARVLIAFAATFIVANIASIVWPKAAWAIAFMAVSTPLAIIVWTGFIAWAVITMYHVAITGKL
jgi:hypothetical protein